ncbi:hypothetical protein G3I59_37140 [Amycolatopsis rubida]|uniref:GntR family transcriptional regulator n=1 Tax=Amycolatopsis rubida TaxID=112413 RepID=A0ABX0C7Y3_9PSEU|nr:MULTISPECIES: YhfZ family protein [Amycolatopsis]MYW96084.1 hypothetical protein [Amycolatopsis rubida]NEC61075.1 hypothetical protein [Amycolatopsis rubida]OAP23405.1 hypothetical protein A4R44_06052 [Amycolatopsis sp. M39]
MTTGTAESATPQQGLEAALRALVVDALAKGTGGTLTTNTALRTELGISAGTIQRALDLLADRGALATVSRGHLGRRIESVDVGAGWQLARLAPVRVVLSPAGAVEMDALEQAIAASLGELGIPHTVQHLRGGSQRLSAVRNGEHDLTVVSSGTLDGTRAAEATAWHGTVRTLEPGTYYAPARLVTVRRTDALTRAPASVAIDRDSFDHEALTRAEFPGDAGFRYVDVPFPDVPAYVAAGIVDAGVWHVTRSPIPVELAGLSLLPISRPEAEAVREKLSRAVLAMGGAREEIRAVLSALQFAQLDEEQNRGFEEEAERASRLRRAARTAAQHTGRS